MGGPQTAEANVKALGIAAAKQINAFFRNGVVQSSR